MAKREKIDDVYKTTDKTNRHDENGHEILNPTPMAPPLGYKPTLSLAEQVRLQVRQMRAMEDNEPESEEEADDFDIADDPPITSRWENDMVPSIKETRARIRELEKQEKLYAKAPEASGKEEAGSVKGSPLDSLQKEQSKEAPTS